MGSRGNLTDPVTLDAIRGVQAGREFYVAMCSLGTIANIYRSSRIDDLEPDLRAQRKLQESRIPEISSYLENNANNYVLSAITVSVDQGMEFYQASSKDADRNVGKLELSLNSKILINDGQHRAAAIERVIRGFKGQDLTHEKVPVIFFSDPDLARSQQIFADLNKHAVKPTKSLGILYDHRDNFAQFIVRMTKELEIFRGRVELEKTSISTRSSKFFTLNGISDATRGLLKFTLRNKRISEEQKKVAKEFWEEVSKNIPEWQLLIEKHVTPQELRKEYVNAHSNLLVALGIFGNILQTEYPKDWKQKLAGLQKIDWSRTNNEWDGKLILNGVMLKNKIGMERAVNLLLSACNVKISEKRKEFEKQQMLVP